MAEVRRYQSCAHVAASLENWNCEESTDLISAERDDYLLLGPLDQGDFVAGFVVAHRVGERPHQQDSTAEGAVEVLRIGRVGHLTLVEPGTLVANCDRDLVGFDPRVNVNVTVAIRIFEAPLIGQV